jgi:uncharacterized protein (DUF433 family)
LPSTKKLNIWAIQVLGDRYDRINRTRDRPSQQRHRPYHIHGTESIAQDSDTNDFDTIALESIFRTNMTLKALEPQLLALSDDEKAQVVQLLSKGKGTLGRGIEKTPHVCGGSACILGTRITVWGLVEARRVGYSEADLLNSYPTLSATDLANAWVYAEAFAEEIETEIQDNSDAMAEAL